VDALADGRLFSADQALENGLIDRIGSIEEAVARLEARAGVGSSTVVSYHRPSEWRRNLYTRATPGAPELGSGGGASAEDWLRPGFHFLWPGALRLPAPPLLSLPPPR
jgi:protease-4